MVTNVKQTVTIHAANDLGAGFQKITMNGERYTFPTAYAVQQSHEYLSPSRFVSKEDEKQYVNKLLNKLDVSIDSAVVSDKGRMYVGESAVSSNIVATRFNVAKASDKKNSDIPLIMSLSTVAAKGLIASYNETNEIPSELTVNVEMTTALPIVEGRKNEAVDLLQERYVNNEHVVTFHNFETPVNVTVNFVSAGVLLEGEVSYYAIEQATDEFKKELKADLDKHNPDFNYITADQLIDIENIIIVDIGESTTDKAVIEDGEIDTLKSNSLQQGYGTVLESALEDLQSSGNVKYKTRVELQKALAEKQSLVRRNKQEKMREIVEAKMKRLSQEIITSTEQTLQKAVRTELIVVLGGGAIPLEPTLRSGMMEMTKTADDETGLPVLFISEKYAQDLNRTGLEVMLEVLVGEE